MPDEPKPPLKDEESKAHCNEQKDRDAIGNEFIYYLKTQQPEFKGNWRQLALLTKNLKDDARVTGIKPEDRLRGWNEWRREVRKDVSAEEDDEFIHLEHAYLNCAHLEYADLMGAHLEHADLQGAHLEHANLGLAHLEHANLEAAHLEHADLDSAHLEHANLSRAQLEHANLQGAHFTGAGVSGTTLNDAYVAGARLIRVRGLFGRDRAGVRDLREAEWAIYSYKFDRVPWSLLRSIGSLRLFGASYAAFTIITAYAALIHWYNEKLTVLHQWAAKTTGSDNSWLAGLIERLPSLPVPAHLGWQLLMIGFLAIGATLYAMFCPEAIKEATETRWTRELNQPVIEYRSAMYSRIVVRYVCAICYAVGGTYTLYYLAHRGYEAIRFLMGG